MPGLAGFWGLLLVLLGGFVRHPVLAVLLAASLVASAAAHVRVGRLVLLGRADARRGGSGPLASIGGRLADASPREMAVLVPLVVLALLVGLWPGPLLSEIADGVRDASAAVELSGERAR
jgi:NADH-quinone oxidoreductase subunit M